MAQEIERARALLGALTRGGVIPAAAAAQAYEAWVAATGDVPFSRHLLDQGAVEAKVLRRTLRLLAVQGLPDPDRYTYERFEDLLLCQLGIEAGMLSPKLVRSVRAVQDKKVAEGKLRRLEQLLARTGFDANLLALLGQHLQERILLCRGCLGRYPRRDLGDVSEACPRCGADLNARAMELSGEAKALPESKRSALLASSAHVLSAPEPEHVSERERFSRPASDQGSGARTFAVILVVLILVGGLAFVLLDKGGPGRVRVAPPSDDGPRSDASGGGDTEQPVEDTAPARDDPPPADPPPAGVDLPKTGPIRLSDAREAEAALLGSGDYAQLLGLWRRVEAGAGEAAADVRGTQQTRIRELESLVASSQEASAAVERLAAGDVPPAEERAMARTLLASPADRPGAFGRLQVALDEQRQRREDAVREGARSRHAEAVTAKSPSELAWARRTEQGKRARPLLGVPLDGRRVDGVRITSLTREAFTVLLPSGEQRRLTWGAQPAVGLRVLRAVCDLTRADDALVLLRAALLARAPSAAAEAAKALNRERDPFDVLIADALLPAPPERLADGGLRIRYPTAWASPSLTPAEETQLTPGPGRLRLSGVPCSVATAPLRAKGWVAATCTIAGSPPRPALTLNLHARGSVRSYVARWDTRSWTLDVRRAGAGQTRVASGRLGARSGVALLEHRDGKVTFSLGGLPLHSESVLVRYEAASLEVGADDDPLDLTALALEGDLDPEPLDAGERAHRAAVSRALLSLPPAGAPTFAPLSVEDPQDLAVVAEEALGALDLAKSDLRAGRLDAARERLRDLEASTPELAAAPYYAAYAAALAGEPTVAAEHVERALARQPAFPEARALQLMLRASSGPGIQPAPGEELARSRPDLALIYVARAWTAFRARQPGADPGASVLDELALAESLATGDPLVQRTDRLLRSALLQESSFDVAVPQGRFTVLSRGAGDDAVAKGLAALAKRLTKKRKLPDKGSQPVVVLRVPRAELRALSGEDASAAYLPEQRWLLLEALGELPAGAERATAAALVDHGYGALPPWLAIGLQELMVDDLSKKPHDLVEVATETGTWDAARWTKLLDMNRREVLADTGARVRCWALLRLRRGAFRSQLSAARQGKPLTRPKLDAAGLEADLAAYLEKHSKD